ncbi:unnamed protein product [Cladocopium goreaui]|uniref:AAA family ATPase n=1 Tax=Cladocopium goreaui TaxID=2562237 RepID=A0A9P1BEV6_9DINO|nr:unnamed protein product [Cladocopium goreaui]
MSDTSNDNLIARLFRSSNESENAWSDISTTEPEHDSHQEPESSTEDVEHTAEEDDGHTAADNDRGADITSLKSPDGPDLEHLLNRISSATGDPTIVRREAATTEAPANETPDEEQISGEWYPIEPTTFQEAKLSESEVESLLLKSLMARGALTGRAMAAQVQLPFKMLDDLLRDMKASQYVYYRGTAPMNDYEYELTDLGRERARRLWDHCTYFGSAPVSINEYVASVTAQSLTEQHPTSEDLKRAFQDLLLNQRMFSRLGPAINSGRGLFLYGAPGNGKTSIAERVTLAFGQTIWVPRALGIDGEIIRLYDPINHEEMPLGDHSGLIDKRRIDKRWIRIRRPTIIVGGELTMESLEVANSPATGISEAPLQLKSNCGTLVIDDFGRQRMTTDELLNRWIVPLEKRYDFLNLANGKKVQVPFDQLIVFSTNLEPKDLVDDAFLRRIPYKIDVCDPSEEEYRELFRIIITTQ